MDRGSAVQANVPFLRELDNAVEYLIGCRQRGENVYYDFNGHRLYSCDVTIDSAYMDVLGVTKEEDDKIAAEMAKAQTPEERKPIIEKFKEIKKQHLEEKKQKATKADKDFLGNLDNAIGYLTERRQLGENVYYDFNGHRLYSCDVTIDSAYMDVLGVTKEEDDKIAAEMAKAQTDEERNEVLKKFAEKRNTNQAPNGGNPGTGTGITKEDDGDLDI